MAIVAGFDVHRRQFTFDALETETGEIWRGRIDATPATVLGGWSALPVARSMSRWRRARVAVGVRCAGGGRGEAASGRAGGDGVRGAGAGGGPRPTRRRAPAARAARRGRLQEAWVAPQHVRQWRSR